MIASDIDDVEAPRPALDQLTREQMRARLRGVTKRLSDITQQHKVRGERNAELRLEVSRLKRLCASTESELRRVREGGIDSVRLADKVAQELARRLMGLTR